MVKYWSIVMESGYQIYTVGSKYWQVVLKNYYLVFWIEKLLKKD